MIRSVFNWFFNTVRVYSLLALYSLTILPYVKDSILTEHMHPWIGLIGMVILILELPAVYYKLIKIRARDEKERLDRIGKNQEDRIVNPPKLLLFALFMHAACRLLVFMVVLNAFGLNYWGKSSDPTALFFLLGFFTFEMLSFIYMYVKTRIFIEPGIDTITIMEDETAQKSWNQKYLPMLHSSSSIKIERWADIIILCFGVVAYVPLWYILNQSGTAVIHEMKVNGNSMIGAFFSLSVMISLLSILSFIPLRVTFWIEESMYAKRNHMKPRLGLQFILFSWVTFAPLLSEWYVNFVSDKKPFWDTWPAVTKYITPPILYLILLIGIELSRAKQSHLSDNAL